MEWFMYQNDVIRFLLLVLLSALVVKSVVTQDALSNDNSTYDETNTQLPEYVDLKDGFSNDNSTYDGINTQLPEYSNILDEERNHNDTLISDALTTSSAKAGPCDHMGQCESEIVCDCYHYMAKKEYNHKRTMNHGREMYDIICNKMYNCTHEDLTYETLLNINFTNIRNKTFDIRFKEHKLKVKDLDVLIQNAGNSGLLSFAGPLQRLPCNNITFHVKRIWGIVNIIAEVNCNNRNLTDKEAKNFIFPTSQDELRLEMMFNKLKGTSTLVKMLDSLPTLAMINLSHNKLKTIPKLNVTNKPRFHLYLDNNDIRKYDSVTLDQYANPKDSISISFDNNPFMCDCEAYYTNEVFIKHRSFFQGGLICSVLDEKTKEKETRRLPTKSEESWRDKCESTNTGYFYLIFTWHNFLDLFLIIANLFFMYIVYDLVMAMRESRLRRTYPKDAKNDRKGSIKSTKSNRKQSTTPSRKISTFSRKNSRPESEISRVDATPPRRPLLDKMVCAVNWTCDYVHNFIHTRVFKNKEVQEEEDKRSTLDWKEQHRLRDLRLDGMRNSQVYDTKL